MRTTRKEGDVFCKKVKFIESNDEVITSIYTQKDCDLQKGNIVKSVKQELGVKRRKGIYRKEESRKGKQRNQEYRIRKTSKMKFFCDINSYDKKYFI